jgi:regulator of protease activity HflC (stomatin/prohibitin superfamily)
MYMTSEQGDSSAIWGEGPNDSKQDQQPDLSSTTQTPDNQGFVIPPIVPDVVEPPQDARSSGKDRISDLIRRFSPVLVPLPFAILIFLFTLPFALRGQVFLPLLPLSVLLIALVVMQGTLLYYAGSNDTYWTLFVIIGYALFLVVGTLAIFGFAASLILLFILLIIGTFLARRSILQVPEGYVDIVMMYGKYARTLYPGPNLKMPLEKVSNRLSTKEISWTCPEQVVKISRDHDVKLVATISYQLLPEDAHLAALQVDNWETSLQKLFVATLQSVINELTPSDFMNWPQGTHARTSVDINSIDAATITRWDRVNDTLAKRVQDKVEKWGVQVNYVRIQDITLIPHLAPSLNPVVGMPARQAPVDVGMTRGGYPAIAQPQQAQIVAKPVENQPVPMPVQPSPASAQAHVSAADIEMLKESYEAVRTGRLKDPHTIRDIAERFESLANDPNIDVDALKAAQILYHRAWIYEQKNKEKGLEGVTADTVVQPDRKERGQANDNIYSGG